MHAATQISETPEQIFERTKAREIQLSRLLVFYITGGLFFMLLPGTFLGVWNLVFISGRRAAESISPAWIQAHGQAQVLGWIGCPYRKVHGNGLLGFSMEAALRLVGLREAESGGGQVQGSARAQKRDREFSSGVHTSLQWFWF